MEQYKREFISFLQDAGVLKFGDFTAKSGRKIPYFINAGDIKTGEQIAKLGEFYAKAYLEKVGNKRTVLYGPAYKGISIAVSSSIALSKEGLDVPFFFNRKEAKDHGEGGSLVGYKPKDGDRLVIIEDVITAGTAVHETMPILQACGNVTVPHMFISVNRCEVGNVPGKTAVMQVAEEFGIQVHALITVSDIREYLSDKPEYASVLKLMDSYMAQYCVL
jgi:orotate phosphoribosyltransferase